MTGSPPARREGSWRGHFADEAAAYPEGGMRGKNGKSQLNGFLDVGSHLHGDLHFEDTFRIDGKLTGKVDSAGDLYVGERGEVEGEIRVGRLFVSGKVKAVVQAQRVEVAAGGQLRGEVETPTLVIDEGAIFEGQSRMVERGAAVVSAGQGLVRGHEPQRVGG
jgi:cytoskeletal protein CcmA (bactofilin family)